MTTDTGSLVPPAFARAIADAADAASPCLSDLSPAERRKHHQRMLRHVGFYKGLEGVKAYKAEHLEAGSLRVNIDAIAYSPKPAGYDAFLTSLAEAWLSSDAAVAATNVADVERLNAKFGTSFPPAKHFSEQVSKGRLKKIKDVFARHGVPLDLTKANTMSKVKAAAKAARGYINTDSRPFGPIGVISGGMLIIRGRSYRIETNGNRECIRPTIGDRRARLYLDDLEWVAEWFSTGEKDTLSTTMVHSIGELPCSSKLAKNQVNSTPEISGLPYGNQMPALTERIAALKDPCERHSTANDESYDPLNDLPLND